MSAPSASSVAVIRSAAAGSSFGFLATNADMTLDSVQAVSNTTGLHAVGSATLRFVNSVVSQNNIGVGNADGVLMGSTPGTSVIAGNSSSDGSLSLGTAMTLR